MDRVPRPLAGGAREFLLPRPTAGAQAATREELNNLLTVVLGYAQLLLDDSTFPATHRTELLELERAARRMTDVLRSGSRSIVP